MPLQTHPKHAHNYQMNIEIFSFSQITSIDL